MGQDTRRADLLERLRAGDGSARERLIRWPRARFVALARAMLRRLPRSGAGRRPTTCSRPPSCGCTGASARSRPEGVRHFDNLAAAQIRRELIDLARSYYGPRGSAPSTTPTASTPAARLAQVADRAGKPESLESWAAFHEAVDRLPDEERGSWICSGTRADARPGRRGARRGDQDGPAAVGLGPADDPGRTGRREPDVSEGGDDGAGPGADARPNRPLGGSQGPGPGPQAGGVLR